MALVSLLVSIAFALTYFVLFLRPKFRLLAGAAMFASLFFLALTLAVALSPNEREAVYRLATIFLGLSGLAAIGLGIAHFIFERGRAGTMTGSRDHNREYTP